MTEYTNPSSELAFVRPSFEQAIRQNCADGTDPCVIITIRRTGSEAGDAPNADSFNKDAI